MSLAAPNDTNSVGWKNLFASFLFAKEPPPLDEKPEIKVRPQYLVDIHTHVSMKMNIWGRKFWKSHTPTPGDGFLSMWGMQVDFHRLRCGHVGVMIVPHDIPVGAMRRQFKFLSYVIRLLNRLFNKMEHEDFSNFTQINKIINLFEEQIYITNRKLGSETFVIARSFEDLMFARNKGKIVFVHAIEGSHALGRNLPPENIYIPRIKRKGHRPVEGGMIKKEDYAKGKEFDRYLDNLVSLKHRGVCMLTLAYLFPNELSDCAEGIAEYPKVHSFRYDWKYDPLDAQMNVGLSQLGKAVVRKMLEIGMIIDLMHSTDATRRQVYELHDEWIKVHPQEVRPITFSHGGSRALHEKYHQKTGVTKYAHHKYYGASSEDILAIERSGGVIGIIIERWWLTGVDTRLPEFEGWELTGIDCVIETIFDINEQTEKKDFSSISIGTDFDGFTDTPPDLYLYEQMGNLLEKMRARLTEEQITKIFSGNALRMLALGWKTM
jgi:microsomal dipeptidase-like Zn-dependent dipeptidase